MTHLVPIFSYLPRRHDSTTTSSYNRDLHLLFEMKEAYVVRQLVGTRAIACVG